MATPDPDRLLALLRDPHVESQEIAALAAVPREEVGRASRLLLGLARAKPEDALTLPAPLAAAVARAALVAGRADLLAALAAHAGKDVSKEAKRGLHVLRARGVAVPEPSRPVSAPPSAALPEPPLPVYASAMDGQGERAVWFTRSLPGRGIEVGQAVLSDERGLLELQVGVLGRKEWRNLAKDLVERGAAMGIAEVARESALAWIAAARALNEQTGQRVPDGADLWLAQLPPGAAAPDPADRFPPLPDVEEREALAASGELHQVPLMQGWLADEGYLRIVAVRLDEVAVSPLYLDERQREEQLERVLADAVDGYFDPPVRARVVRRLFAVADHLQRLSYPAHAASAAAVARALAVGVAPRAIPFARLLVEKAFPREPSAPPEAGPAPSTGTPLIIAPR
jgi:hypothetical protein